MSTVTIDPNNDYLYRDLKVAVYYNLFVGIAYGVFVVFYAVSAHILVGRPGLLSSQPRIFMLAITTFMFILGLIGLVLKTAIRFQQMYSSLDLTGGGIWSFTETNIISSTIAVIMFIMYILSDIICAWRAVVLWNKDKRVIAILLLFTLVNIAAAGFVLVLNIRPTFMDMNLGYTALTMVVPTLGINLLSTGLIGWKAWEHRVTIRKHLGEGTVSMRVEKIFAILIESGLVYCCFWILYLVLAFVNPGLLLSARNEALLIAPGVYSTLIIVLVSTQKSPIEYYSNHASGMTFANNGPSFGLHNQAGRVVPQQDEEKSV